jgi:hypothetical protein
MRSENEPANAQVSHKDITKLYRGTLTYSVDGAEFADAKCRHKHTKTLLDSAIPYSNNGSEQRHEIYISSPSPSAA